MKYIRANEDNTIHLISDKKRKETVPYGGELPGDFYNTFSKGKYLFVDGEIVHNPQWGNSNKNEGASGENEEELPQDIPHRGLLIAAGILTLSALLEIEDLTTITGIGVVKAGEINIYLSTTNKR